MGELDEEMVFESRTGDTIILGATTWRIEKSLTIASSSPPLPASPAKCLFGMATPPDVPPNSVVASVR